MAIWVGKGVGSILEWKTYTFVWNTSVWGFHAGLMGVWHKDNLYLGTTTIENEKPPPNEYWFANEKYKDDTTKIVVLR
jgi:hypothetical protein